MAEVVTLGECLISFVAVEPGPLADAARFDRFVAGAEANVAVGLARLGHSAEYLGRVGSDGFGEAIRRRLRSEGVGTAHLTTDIDGPTGLMFRERRNLGPAQVVYTRRGSAGSRLSVDDVDRAADAGLFADARWLHLTGITPALSDSARAATVRAAELGDAAGLTISLDVNLRRRLWSDADAAPVLRGLARAADVVLGSPDELAVLGALPPHADAATVAGAILALGPTTVVFKLGAQGGQLFGGGARNAAISRPALAIPVVVDPVGAGDAFCAGFIAASLEGLALDRALEWANACGAASAASLGDQTGLPDPTELAALLAMGAGTPDTIR